MSTDRDLLRNLRSWLHEDAHEDADRILNLVLDEIDTTPQRRSPWSAWRRPIMNTYLKVGLAAAVVLLAGFIGIKLFSSPSVGSGGESPSASPSASATPSATSSPASAPPLTQSFTSTQHGISLSYPEGWSVQAATEPWTDSTFPLSFPVPQVDWLYDPILTSDLFLAIASQPIGDLTPEEWIAQQMASGEGCGTATETIVVDSANGLIGTGGCDVAVVTTAGRGYWIQLYTSGDHPSKVAPYNTMWFKEVLATVQLQPEDAVDSAPSPSP